MEKEFKKEIPTDFNDLMDFLSADEEEAIEGYDEVIKKVDDDHIVDQLEKIRTEEEAHKAYLNNVKEDPTIDYVEPLEDEDEEDTLQEKIVRKGKKYQVQSEKGRNMGTYDSEAEAKKRLNQIEYFKSKKNEDYYTDARPYSSQLDELREIISDGDILDALVRFLPDDTLGEFIESEYSDYFDEE